MTHDAFVNEPVLAAALHARAAADHRHGVVLRVWGAGGLGTLRSAQGPRLVVMRPLASADHGGPAPSPKTVRDSSV